MAFYLYMCSSDMWGICRIATRSAASAAATTQRRAPGPPRGVGGILAVDERLGRDGGVRVDAVDPPTSAPRLARARRRGGRP